MFISSFLHVNLQCAPKVRQWVVGTVCWQRMAAMSGWKLRERSSTTAATLSRSVLCASTTFSGDLLFEQTCSNLIGVCWCSQSEWWCPPLTMQWHWGQVSDFLPGADGGSVQATTHEQLLLSRRSGHERRARRLPLHIVERGTRGSCSTCSNTRRHHHCLRLWSVIPCVMTVLYLIFTNRLNTNDGD